MLKSIEILLEELNKHEIIYCHFKSNEHLKESMVGDTDLDILFLPSQRDKIEKVLHECGLKRFRATNSMQYNAIEDFIGFDQETAKIWHLHLHYRLTLGEKHLKGYTIPWEEHILSNRVYNEDKNIYCSNPNDEFFLIYIRMALKIRWRDYFQKIGKEDLLEINWLKKRIDSDEVIKTVRKLLGEEFVVHFNELINRNIFYSISLVPLQSKLRKRLKYYTSNTKFQSYLKRTLRELSWLTGGISRKFGLNLENPKRRVSPSGGAVVIFLGSDGAGKSTTMNYIEKEFSKKIDVKSVYLGSGDGSSSIIRYPMKLVAQRIGGKGLGIAVNKELASDNQRRSLKSNLYLTAKILWGIALAFEKKRKIEKITKARNNGVLVLVDRYPQVETLGYNDGPLLSNYKTSTSKILRKIANWEYYIYKSGYINPPDLILKLMVPVKVAIDRKPEMTEQEIADKIEAVKNIKLPGNNLEINTDRDIIKSLGEAMAAIWTEV